MAIYHLTMKTGSTLKGQSALAKSNYISRKGKYAHRKNDDEVLFVESINLPAWAETTTGFWKAADQYERANARLFKEMEFALPIELTLEQQVALIADFIATLFPEEDKHPLTAAIHAGKGTNPHCHLMFSERVDDGFTRTPKGFFKRANKNMPEKGGALKKDCSKKWWLKNAREAWALCVNRSLEQINSLERVSHLSLDEQGIDREPQLHRGVKTHNAMKHGRETARTEKILEREALVQLEDDISVLELKKVELEKVKTKAKTLQRNRRQGPSMGM